MEYQRLPFETYFIDNSEDWNKTEKQTRTIDYTAVKYTCNIFEKIFGMVHEMNYEILFLPDRNVIQLNFQQTNGKMDWFANIFEFSSKYYTAIPYDNKLLQLRVHHGWAEMYKSVKYDIRHKWQKLHKKYPAAETEIIGWSLGSGQAILCAQDLNYNFGCMPHLFTYGSVRPFKGWKKERAVLASYLSTLCTECYNFSNINDIVTYMPPFKGWTNIRRVDVGLDVKKTVKNLLNPYHFHTIYDHEELYKDIE